jgi:hypothetical protein
VAIKRGIVLLGCAAAVAFGSVGVAAPAAAKDCPWGTSPTRFPGVCAPGGPGGTAGGGAVLPPTTSDNSGVTYQPGQLPQANGVPCTPDRVGLCYAAQQNG